MREMIGFVLFVGLFCSIVYALAGTPSPPATKPSLNDYEIGAIAAERKAADITIRQTGTNVYVALPSAGDSGYSWEAVGLPKGLKLLSITGPQTDDMKDKVGGEWCALFKFKIESEKPSEYVIHLQESRRFEDGSAPLRKIAVRVIKKACCIPEGCGGI